MTLSVPETIIQLCYLAAAVLFIIGLKRLSSPATARYGNRLAALGMAIALVATLFTPGLRNLPLILIGLVIGAAVSTYASEKVKMTQMPQMVAIFNGLGGGTAALVSVVEFQHKTGIGRGEIASIVLGTIIGSISFAGSMIAFAKLQELMSGRPIVYSGQQLINAALGVVIVILGVAVVVMGEGSLPRTLLVLMFLAALALGALVVLPIGGADMPVVIAILNSLTGLAAALTGFVLSNQALVVAGVLVGASGSLLTVLMARAMNRSIANILFGAFGAAPHAASAVAVAERPVQSITPEDVAWTLAMANRVIIVPGYGLAVARGQQAVRELADILEKERGIDVRYAIHPVAGRMPGHMNVLLAEANIPYESLKQMEEINDEFPNTDVVLVIGANDVVNPAAHDPNSPLAGMPILDVDKTGDRLLDQMPKDRIKVIVFKRGRGTGFAGIDNELFYNDKTSILFGNAKDSLDKVVASLKQAVGEIGKEAA
ncbi:MAG TPA: NAD(P)(+) transhydrogenase (Re/Si-specific) subunit beta [Thermomicrobiales bacterium]|jgi:NAD(P) transhydrogenase subunit beta|nr:NAD(P)(+) transhydrogenase (Re/Si-specific) subunit beta [Thermomicrobiales bacterium]